jgi:hypothetical protein
MPRSKCAFTQDDAIRILKVKQKLEQAAQKTGIPLPPRVTLTTAGGSSIVIDFQNPNGDIGSNGSHVNEWDVPLAGSKRPGHREA